MQGSENTNNVVSLFEAKSKAAKKKAAESEAVEKEEKKESTETFEEIIRRNTNNLERLRKERSSANKSVLKSYRIKH